MDKKIVKNEKELNNYSEYNKLNDSYRYCLLGNNYWHIMNGEYNRFVPVPTTDLHFWYYFNETCFVECDAFQRRKKAEAEERRKNEIVVIDDEFKAPEPIKEIIEPEPIIEINKTPEPELIKEPEKIAEMPMEENKDFLKEKQEHPKYEKRVLEKDNSTEPEKKEQDKKTKKTDKPKKKDNGQIGLF